MKINKFQVHSIVWLTLALLLSCISTAKMYAQSEETPIEKQRARISLDYTNINNKQNKLVATVKTKVERRYTPVVGVKIRFYHYPDLQESLLGTAVTGINGEAVLEFEPDSDAALHTTYLARLTGDPNFREVEKEIEIRKAILNFELEEVDSVRAVRVSIVAPDSLGNKAPAEDVEVMVYVERLFGLMPIIDRSESTDEEGLYKFEFPVDIPGDENGQLTIVARVNDHEEFGNLEFRKSAPWGMSRQASELVNDKELWLSTSNVPKILTWIVSLILAGIIAVIIYVIYQIFLIKKLGLKE